VAKQLERDLGLYATITVSIGAMIGSGIFVLPGLAAKIAGPAVILAYLLAGLLVLPAALSKAEMATAMPESGGTYLYIDRAMGPLPGTIAGIGAWFSLVFKSGFALVGLGAYLLLFAPGVAAQAKFISLALAALLVAVNVLGVKQSGRLQAVVVTLVLFALVLFIGNGLTFVDQPRYHPFFAEGASGLLAATGFVFVSYAGVTKIASVAEEVENPGRNIPIGILGSVLLMMLVYTFALFVVVGVSPADQLGAPDMYTPMALAAGQFLGPLGESAIALVAVLALTSMANAGVLSSSRFPLAMSRDELAPDSLGEIHERFRTPVYAIVVTGGLLLLLVAFVPVVELAKLASAFKILIFALANAALIAFRESGLDWYDPEFVAPGYPWVQLFGIVGGLVLLTQMGLLPMAGAAGIVVVGVVWYRVYGREKVEREGAALDAIRRTTGSSNVETLRELFATGGGGGVLVALGPNADLARAKTLLVLAESVVKRRGGSMEVVRFEEVPDQVTLSSAAATRSPDDERFEREAAQLSFDLEVPVEVTEVVAHDVEYAVANHAREAGVNLLVGEWQTEFFHGELLGRDVDWYIEHVPVDLALVRNRGLEAIDDVVVIADKGPYDPLEVLFADAIAREHDAQIRFVYAVDEGASDEELAAIRSYHDELDDLCTVHTERDVLREGERADALVDAADGADLAIVSTSAHHLLYDVVFGAIPDRLAAELDCTVLMVHSNQPRRHTFLRYLLERVAF